ncbi:TetR/AcrR family transcriptional regulator C-terminal domain-containing protein [Nonomuraea sp. SYSU D8015]|uniref:TetR/AcrR family transcriptional regulator C-terminal domain-containing protein n=1 Tax=Nonomuraea sp. SYSU D8015 TaxID=2593644 RepID=UPI0016609ECB|nr:TetR/AcrR family transcriptional regulator C-terminal domain-containing protein [Nonomuraea sp. SYSU D8015]
MPRETLSREQIVRAAVEVLDAEGVEGLNMRRLGAWLGSAATAVYWHVKNKDDLVVLAADEVWGEIELPDVEQVGWREAAAAMARNLHAMVIRHPWLVTAMSTHLIYGPGKARHDNHLIGVYEAAGFTGRQVEWAMNAVFVFALGQAIGEASDAAWRRRLRRAGGDPEERERAAIEQIAEIASRFPRLRARMDAPGDDGPGQRFEFGLQTVLDGLEARLGAR